MNPRSAVVQQTDPAAAGGVHTSPQEEWQELESSKRAWVTRDPVLEPKQNKWHIELRRLSAPLEAKARNREAKLPAANTKVPRATPL